MAHRIQEVLTEVGDVRRELGWPVMATPLSQLVGTQAVLNVVTGERYGMVPDEVVAYAVGHYGQPPALIDADVLDKIMSSRRAAQIAANPPEQPTLRELRRRHGTTEDEDDLLILKALIPASDIEAMQAAGPVRRDYPLGSREVEEVRALIATASAPYIRVSTERWELELQAPDL
jgi:oxaloacetate decarboxylase alpha subunit